jgi:nucleotide-binding universal stress UspA family protein
MKTILIPTDFSEISHNAIEYAAEMALQMHEHSKIILLHVYQVQVMSAEAPVVIPVWEDIEKDCMNALKKIEHNLYRKYVKNIDIKCVCRIGFVVDEIIKQYTIENNIDLIVMGMQGASFLSEKLMGSNTTSLIRKANCPVLIINEHIKFKKIERIVLACDFENISNELNFGPIKKLASAFK